MTDITFVRVIEPLSMLDLPQLEFLARLARQAPDGTAVECGVWRGGSVIAWESERRGRGTVYAIDDFSGAQGQSGYALQPARGRQVYR